MLKPRQGSLFAVLLRSPWWVSLLIAGGLIAVASFFLPLPLAIATSLPFLGIAGYTGWRFLQAPSPARVAAAMEQLRALPWQQFAALLTEAFQRQGYEVRALTSGPADLELRKNGYVSLASCKRWKVTQTGIAPLRDLARVQQGDDVRDCIYIAAGDFTATARAFAAENGIRLLFDAELAGMLQPGLRASRSQAAKA